MKNRIAFTILGLAIGMTASHAASLPDRIQKAGKIVFLTEGAFPPITYYDPKTNQLTGFEVDLGNEIAKELGIAVDWQVAPFAQLFPSLRTGRVDAILAGIRDTPKRRESFDFINNLLAGAQFYTMKSSSDRFRDGVDLCGQKVGANAAANWTRWIEEWSKRNCVANGKPPIQVVGAENTLAARMELKTGRLAAAVAGKETMAYTMKTEPGIFTTVGKAFAEAPTGIMTTKTAEGEQIRDAIAAALTRVHASGAYDKVLEKYGLQSQAWKPVTINKGTEP